MSSVSEALALLSAPEYRRYTRLRTEEARHDFLAVRSLARRLVAEVTGAPTEEVVLAQTCLACAADGHGPPRVVGSGIQVSWAHSGGELAVAVSTRCRVGVDVESLDRPALSPALLAAALPPCEIEQVTAARDTRDAFLRLWTVKEALAKLGSDVLTMTRRTTSELADAVGAADYWTETRDTTVLGVAVAPLE